MPSSQSMQKIENIFDESRDLYRTIEKVIQFGVDQEDRLRNEIREYIVTPGMENEFEDLLAKMQRAMEEGGPNEVGVWVSGFYGSGKSSFAKYLGLALDDSIVVDGQPFIKHLLDRFKKQKTKQLLATTARKFPAAVVFLDLASDMLAGRPMEEISTVLFYKVLEYAGYSRNVKVYQLERRLKKDGRFDEFKEKIKSDQGVEWKELKNDFLVVDSVIPEIAHQMYPNIFKSATAFSTETGDIFQFETDRVQEMLEIVRAHSGKEYIVFIIDEVGQYVASSKEIILNLDGLAKNLKTIGDGKAWIMSTAQQTLTEDDPRAAFNSPELFKLDARFPIKIDLPASDIKQICYERLLKKSEKGKALLEELFAKKGQELRQNTKLENADYYAGDFDSKTFTSLYPFLPSHFQVLLHFLGRLAKSTGGFGLRSAIKVIQDILIEGPDDQDPICQKPVGWLATMVTLFDVLENDIKLAYATTHSAFEKIAIQFPDSQIHSEIGKTVVVLQILDNLPVTRRNVTALMHSSVDLPSQYDSVEKAVDELINEPRVPFDEQDGELCFVSEKLSDIQNKRSGFPLPGVNGRRILNQAIQGLFEPLPTHRLLNTLPVPAGLKARSSGHLTSLVGEKYAIQTIVEFVPADDFDTRQTSLVDESRSKSCQNDIFMLARHSEEFDKLVEEIYRSEEIAGRFKSDPDKDVRGYCNSELDKAEGYRQKLKSKLGKSLLEGVFIFRADKTAVDSRGSQLLEACKKFLGENVAARVFEHYGQASVRVETAIAESFLKIDDLRIITENKDPLGLVKQEGVKYQIDIGHPAICSISDYLSTTGESDGQHLIKRFVDAPYGWSPDTLRYLIAAMLRAGHVKLKTAGRNITAVGQQAIDALKNNVSFKRVVVGLRDNPPDMEQTARAAERLMELTAQTVVPLEEDVNKAAVRYFNLIQNNYGSLIQRLKHLELPGLESLQGTCDIVASSLQNDCSDAVKQIGATDSTVFNGLKHASKVSQAFDRGLGETIEKLKETISAIKLWPSAGVLQRLQLESSEQIELIQSRLYSEEFYEHSADYQTTLTQLNAAIDEASKALAVEQELVVRNARKDLQNVPEWKQLSNEERLKALAEVDTFLISADGGIAGINQLINNGHSLFNHINVAKDQIEKLGKDREFEQIKQNQEKNKRDGIEILEDSVSIKKTITSHDDFKVIIQDLQEVNKKAKGFARFSIKIKVKDDQ